MIFNIKYCKKMEFKWLNESTIEKSENKIIIMAPGKTDFFRGIEEKSEEGFLPNSLSNAPFYYTEIEGNFVIKAKVSHEFKDVYDSASLMIMQNLECWAKACYEYTDFGTHAIVSVVTNGFSDDANGCNLEGNTAWLQMCRVGNNFAIHYSTDGEKFYMVRFFTLPASPIMKVGLLAQCPLGSGGKRIYENLTIEKKTVKNIRAGK